MIYILFFPGKTSTSGNMLNICIIKCGVCGQSNVQMLTCPPILKLWDTKRYLGFPYDLTELIGETYGPFFLSFKKRLYVVPSTLLSFLQVGVVHPVHGCCGFQWYSFYLCTQKTNKPRTGCNRKYKCNFGALMDPPPAPYLVGVLGVPENPGI